MRDDSLAIFQRQATHLAHRLPHWTKASSLTAPVPPAPTMTTIQRQSGLPYWRRPEVRLFATWHDLHPFGRQAPGRPTPCKLPVEVRPEPAPRGILESPAAPI